MLMVLLVIGGLMLSVPATVIAQVVEPPPLWQGDDEVDQNDILVFEPQLFFELPFTQGFKISFNLGISFQVPRQLNFVTNDVTNFFLRFRSFILPAGGGTTEPTTGD
jgi:hypothetical protein